MWCGMPPESRILDNCCCISPEKSSFVCSKSAASEIGRTAPRLPRAFPFHAMLGSRFRRRGGRADAGVVTRVLPFVSWTPVGFSLTSSSSSSQNVSCSISMSSGKSPSSSSSSPQDSGSLNILSAIALPGMLLNTAVNGAEDINGDSSTSRSG